MNSGKYVFAQVLSYVNRYEFDCCVKRYNGDHRVKTLDCWALFVQLLFGQLTARESLRDICLCLKVHRCKIYHLGMKQNVDQSTLSRANESRDYRIFRDFGYYLISIVRPLYESQAVEGITIDNTIFALDSTTISLSIKLFSWAHGKYSRGAAKVHTLLDLRGNIPAFIHVTDGKWHDSNVLDLLYYEDGDIYVMDKAYFDLVALYKIERAGAFFITRPKKKFSYEVIESRFNYDYNAGIRGDEIVTLKGSLSKKHYPKAMRLVSFWDEEKDEYIDFVTNNFDLTAKEVADIYRKRWQIEVFFKWIKQNLVIKHLWGTSENAVNIHIWVAISAYLIVAYLKAQLKSKLSTYEILQVLSLSALDKTSIVDLLSETNSNQYVKDLPTLFD